MHKPPLRDISFLCAICLSSAHLFIIVSMLEHVTNPFTLVMALELHYGLNFKIPIQLKKKKFWGGGAFVALLTNVLFSELVVSCQHNCFFF